MLHARLQNSATDDCHDLPARSFVRLLGASLRTPAGREIVRREENGWRIGEQFFDTLSFDSPSTVRFVSGNRRSDTFGPFDSVTLVSNQVHANNGSAYLLAELDDRGQRWRCGDDAETWFSIVITRADAEMEVC